MKKRASPPKRNNDLSNIISNLKSRKQNLAYIAKDQTHGLPSGTSTIKQQSLNADVMTLIGQSQREDSSRALDSYDNQASTIEHNRSIQNPYLIIKEVKETKGDLEFDEDNTTLEQVQMNSNA